MGSTGDEDVFGRRVRDERVSRGWTQAQLAEYLKAEGVTLHPSAIAKIEDRNAATPRAIRLDEAAALARVFGLQLGDMFATPSRRIIRDFRVSVISAYRRLEFELRSFQDFAEAAPVLVGPVLEGDTDRMEALSHLLDEMRSIRELAEVTERSREKAEQLLGVIAEHEELTAEDRVKWSHYLPRTRRGNDTAEA